MQPIEEFLDNKCINLWALESFKLILESGNLILYILDDTSKNWRTTHMILNISGIIYWLKKYSNKNKELLDDLINLFPEYII